MYIKILQLFCVIVMGCISSKGWYHKKDDPKEYCVFNDDTNACNYGVGISVLAFIASVGFVVGEYLFEQMSSVKTRKHYVLADLGFSGEYLPAFRKERGRGLVVKIQLDIPILLLVTPKDFF